MKIQILAVLCGIQCLLACQPAPDDIRTSAAGIGFQPSEAAELVPLKALQPATNVVFQSADGGRTWQDISTGLPGNVQPESVFAAENELFIGTQHGLYRSGNATSNPVWQQTLFLYGRITAVFPGRAGLLACSYERGLFQNISGTDIWMPISATLKDKSVRTVLETKNGTLFVGCDSGVYKSADKGQTWKQVFDKGIILNIVLSGDVLIGGGVQGVIRSADNGEHWDYVLNENILAKKTGLIGDHFVTILGARDATKVSPEGITHRLRSSDDGGQTWHRLDEAPLPVKGVYNLDERLSQVKDAYDIVQAGEFLFCSFDTGIFRSADQGRSWEPVFTSEGRAFNLAVSGQVVYAVQGPGGGC